MDLCSHLLGLNQRVSFVIGAILFLGVGVAMSTNMIISYVFQTTLLRQSSSCWFVKLCASCLVVFCVILPHEHPISFWHYQDYKGKHTYVSLFVGSRGRICTVRFVLKALYLLSHFTTPTIKIFFFLIFLVTDLKVSDFYLQILA